MRCYRIKRAFLFKNMRNRTILDNSIIKSLSIYDALVYSKLPSLCSHYTIGDSVYLKTDPEQAERLVTGVNIRQNGISYALSYLTDESYHYDFEITKERDIIKATSS